MAYGMYLLNPPKKRRSKSRRRVARRGKKRASKINPPMKKTRRRRKARSALRNPSRRRRSRRARVARRNPVRRRRRSSMRSARRNPSRRRRFARRNPGSGIIAEFTNQDMLATAGGLITGTILAPLIVTKLTKPGSMLPGLDPAKPSAIGRTVWKAALAGGAGFLLRNKAPRFAEGLMLGAVAIVGTDLLAQSGLIAKLNTAAGVSRYYGSPRGTGAYLPGTSPTFTGPGSAFLRPTGVPMLRRPGTGAALTRGAMRNMASMVENPFAN